MKGHSYLNKLAAAALITYNIKKVKILKHIILEADYMNRN